MTVPHEESRPRVLIIDDSGLSNRVMIIALRLRGFLCSAVTNEAKALPLIPEFEPDVVILEWADRFERDVDKAGRIRAHARMCGRSVAIIVVTHEYDRPDRDVLSTIDGYFTKPVMIESLEETIIRVSRHHVL